MTIQQMKFKGIREAGISINTMKQLPNPHLTAEEAECRKELARSRSVEQAGKSQTGVAVIREAENREIENRGRPTSTADHRLMTIDF